MKRITALLLSLILALLLIPVGLSFAEPAEGETPDVISLLGTWLVVEGGRYADGSSTLTFFADRRGGEPALSVYDRVLSRIIGSVSLDNGFFSVPEVAAKIEEEYGLTNLSIAYQLEDSPDCDPFVWDSVFNGWIDMATNTPMYTEEMVRGYYEKDPKDKLTLHITGTDTFEKEVPVEFDTTLVLVKVLPMFFDSLDKVHLNGTWKDTYGDVFTFVWSEDDLLDGSLDEIHMTDPKGVEYISSFSSIFPFVENGEILLRTGLSFENDVLENIPDIDYTVTNLVYDGSQIVITMETGETFILTPAA